MRGIKNILTMGFVALAACAQAAKYDNYFSTNRHPQLYPIRVSSMGLLNGTSTNANAGGDFSLDTPNTTTSGIQEALNSIPIGTNQGPYMAPITIQLGPGNFFYTNVVKYSNSYCSGIEIAGAGAMNTTLIYAGATTVSNTFEITGGPHSGGSLNLPFQVTVRDLTMTALNQATNVLLYVSGSSYTKLADMNFTGWNVRTNQNSGAAVSIIANSAEFPPGLVGYHINNSLDHSTILQNIFHAGLAVGGRVKSDHPVGYNLKFALISFGTYGNTNIWSTNDIYNIGATIILEDNVYDSRWFYGHVYGARCGFANVGGDLNSPTLYGWHFETASYPIVSDSELVPVLVDPVSTPGGSSSDFFQYILRSPTSDNYPGASYILTTDNHPYGFARGSGRTDSADYAFWIRRANEIVLNVDSSDVLTANGSGLINLVTDSQIGTFSSPNTTTPLALAWPTVENLTVYAGITGEYDLPAAAGYINKSLILYNTGAFTLTVDPNGSEIIVRDGTAQSAGISMTLSSGSGNFVCLRSDGSKWITFGYKGTLGAGS